MEYLSIVGHWLVWLVKVAAIGLMFGLVLVIFFIFFYVIGGSDQAKSSGRQG